MDSASGTIFDVQRFSIHDGPGVRTTVFLKGCPLRCRWCHNPEGQRHEPELLLRLELCVGCGECARVCPRGAHSMDDAEHRLDRERCAACGACAAACPSEALEMVGRRAGVREVMAGVLRDREFFDDSGGGLTLSGGEPTAQPEFAAALLAAARAEGLATAVETCGYCEGAALDRLRPLVDLFLFDLKAAPARHRELTGVDAGPILANLRRLHESGARVRLRLPMVPGVNDTDEHFRGTAAIAHELTRLDGVDLLPCHPLAGGKYRALGLAGLPPNGSGTTGDAVIAGWRSRLRELGVDARKPD